MVWCCVQLVWDLASGLALNVAWCGVQPALGLALELLEARLSLGTTELLMEKRRLVTAQPLARKHEWVADRRMLT